MNVFQKFLKYRLEIITARLERLENNKKLGRVPYADYILLRRRANKIIKSINYLLDCINEGYL